MRTIIVENSLAPGAIGDTLAAFPAIHAIAWESGAKVFLSSEPCRNLLYHPKVEILQDRPDEASILDVQQLFAQYAGTGLSMTRAYLKAIGLELLAQQPRNPEVILSVGLGEEPEEKFDFLVAPFSASDNGTLTKVWPTEHWKFLISTLHDHGQKIGILGGASDDTGQLGEGGLPILGKSLSEVCRMVRTAKAVVTVDCGVQWLCQGMQANHVLLLPQTAHPNWTANPNQNAVNLMIGAKPQEVLGALGYLAKLMGTK